MNVQSDQRLEGMEKDFTENEGPQRIVVHEKKKKNVMMMMMVKKNRKKNLS